MEGSGGEAWVFVWRSESGWIECQDQGRRSRRCNDVQGVRVVDVTALCCQLGAWLQVPDRPVSGSAG